MSNCVDPLLFFYVPPRSDPMSNFAHPAAAAVLASLLTRFIIMCTTLIHVLMKELWTCCCP